jgi:hypothetical protein
MTVYRYIDRGLPVFRLGGLRVDVDLALAWLRNQQAEPKEKPMRTEPPTPEKARPLTTTIESIPSFSTRTKNALSNAGVETLADLLRIPREQLLKTPNLGRITMVEIDHELKSQGLSLELQCRNVPSRGVVAFRVEVPVARAEAFKALVATFLRQQ